MSKHEEQKQERVQCALCGKAMLEIDANYAEDNKPYCDECIEITDDEQATSIRSGDYKHLKQ